MRPDRTLRDTDRVPLGSRRGSPHGLPVLDRIARRLESVGECRVWSGAKDQLGYGIVKVDGRARRLTRVVWEENYGPIPTGLLVCHSCDNPSCARLDHLMLGTQRANIQDMLAKGRRPARRKAA